MQEYTACFNDVCHRADAEKLSNGVDLHKLTYAQHRVTTHLPSQLICAARVKATESIKSVLAQRKKQVQAYQKRLKQAKKSGKPVPLQADANHVTAKQIVCSCQPGDFLVLENLTDLRQRTKGRRQQRHAMSNWSFAQLQWYIAYKAAYKGVAVEFVDARYSSQCCSRCGHIARSNRVSQSEFSCKQCGYSNNADYNAALNLARRAKGASSGSNLSDGLSSRPFGTRDKPVRLQATSI